MRSIRDINYKKILSLFWQQNGSPFFNAKGLAIGVFCGCFPFFGFQTFLGILFSRIVKGNIFLAAIGTWISNPLTYVPLYYFNYKVGSMILKNTPNNIIEKNLVTNDLWKQGSIFSQRLLLGSSLVGFLLALFSGSIIFFVYKIRNKR